MPQYKPLQSLRELAMISVIFRIQELCLNITNEEAIGNYLQINMRPLLADACNVLQSIMNTDVLHTQPLMENSRALYRVMMHSRMITFHYNSIIVNNANLQFDTVFWEHQLAKLEIICELDISAMECTDGILETIGRHCCSNLESLVVSSVVVSKRSCDEPTFTERGFMSLVTCKKLRILRDRSCGFENIGMSCMRTFLDLVTTIEHLNYKHMGDVLSSMPKNTVESLNLLVVRQEDVEPRHVNAIEKLPSVKELRLSYCLDSHTNPTATLYALTYSSLGIQSIDLRDFPFDFAMESFFINKGNELTTLNLSCSILDTDDIKTLGNNCKNVLALNVTACFEVTDIIDDNQDVMFEKMTKLTLTGNLKWAHGIIQMFLLNALSIEVLVLNNVSSYVKDELFQPFTNALSELTRLKLKGLHSTVSKDTICAMLKNCVKLSYISIICNLDEETFKYMEELDCEVQQKNWNLEVVYLGKVYTNGLQFAVHQLEIISPFAPESV